MPIAAVTQTMAAVVRPRTASPRTKEPAADEADARHDLRRDARRIERDAVDEDVAEAVLAHEDEQRGSDADQRVRPQPGGLLGPLALEPAQRGEREREAELPDLLDPLTAGEPHGEGRYGDMQGVPGPGRT
jgi:hypothetical protein